METGERVERGEDEEDGELEGVNICVVGTGLPVVVGVEESEMDRQTVTL